MKNEMIIPQSIYQEMIKHGYSSLPYEACGFLAGKENLVQSIWTMENELKSDRRFFVNKQVVKNNLEQIKNRGEQVMAVYHSHPTTAPVPSWSDLAHHMDQKIKMMIVSFKYPSPKVKCYQITPSSFRESPFLIDSLF
ncbi:M67 family metallopeptidase [Halobacillus salinarum]|uniref:M67 family metallopeptidase n=1 Tax=Halobacillus salinarum TaxID=2932257 RepID=A0ABY4ENJ0_9BACI|nr:M67 family metallopeptidase [Halobacillus salinarum]UOQ45224.1 M67 family metallopeptidase [Halobacillus salinarum]